MKNTTNERLQALTLELLGPIPEHLDGRLLKVNEIFKSGNIIGSLLLLSLSFREYREDQEKIWNITAKILDLPEDNIKRTLENSLRFHAGGDMYKRVTDQVRSESSFIYSELIISWLNNPLSIHTLQYFFVLEVLQAFEPIQNDKVKLISQMKEFSLRYSMRRTGTELFRVLQSIEGNYWYSKKYTERYKILADIIIQEIGLLGEKDWIISLWALYLYIEGGFIANRFAEEIDQMGLNLEEEYLSFLSNPRWPWYKSEYLAKRYKENESKNRGEFVSKEVWKKLQASLQDASPVSLIAMVLYAKHRGDLMSASRFLWYACRSYQFPMLEERLRELTGGIEPTASFQQLPMGSRTSWFVRKIALFEKEIRYKINDKQISREVKEGMKDFYFFQPFHFVTIGTLIKMTSQNTTKELKEMCWYSINQLTSYFELGKLGRIAGITNNHEALLRILLRLSLLEMPKTMLYIVDELLKEFQILRQAHIVELIRFIIDFYQKVVTKNLQDTRKIESINKEIHSVHGKVVELLQFEDQMQLAEEKEAFGYLKAFDYERLFRLIENKGTRCSSTTLELGLQLALRIGNSSQGISCYKMLAKSSPSRAVAYNQEIEAFIVVDNLKTKQSGQLGRFSGGSVWGNVAMLENPIDYLTARVAFNIGDNSEKLI